MKSANFWVDSHCHPHYSPLDEYDVFKEALDNNVGHMLCVSTSLADFEILKKIKEEKGSQVSISIGAHPLNEDLGQTDWAKMEYFASDPAIVAIGETGFDFQGNIKLQHEAFDQHANIASKNNLPIILHTRETEEDVKAAIKRWPKAQGVFHCFTGSQELAYFAIDNGWKISFSGIITFKNAENLRDIAKKIPKSSVLIETDAPFLAPIPFRGKPNKPALVSVVGQFLADLWAMEGSQVAKITSSNFKDLFPRSGISV